MDFFVKNVNFTNKNPITTVRLRQNVIPTNSAHPTRSVCGIVRLSVWDAVRLLCADIAEGFEGIIDIGITVGFTHMPDADDFAAKATHTTG